MPCIARIQLLKSTDGAGGLAAPQVTAHARPVSSKQFAFLAVPGACLL